MEINSSNGINAYANVPHTTPSTDNSQLRQENTEASRSDIDPQSSATQAFEVSITQEAQDRLAAENTQETEQAQAAAQPEDNTNEPAAPAQNTSPVVNIVA